MARIKQFIVRKYVLANSATQAIRLERNRKVDEVFVDDQWVKDHPEPIAKSIGFKKHG